MSKATKYPAWFDYYRQPYFYGVRPVPVNEILTEIKSETQDGRYDHVVFENDEIRVLADITGSEDYGLELEVRTYKKEVSSNEKYEALLKEWEESQAEANSRLAEWKVLRAKKDAEIQADKDKSEYLRLKKIFEPTQP